MEHLQSTSNIFRTNHLWCILLKFAQISSLSDGDGLEYRSIPPVSQPPWPGVQVDGATHSNPVRADVCTDCGRWEGKI